MFQICALYLSIDGNLEYFIENGLSTFELRVVDTIDHKRDIITLLVVSLNTAQEYYTIPLIL